MNKIVIGAGSSAKMGKDTLCNLLIEEFAKQDILAKRFALADELKEMIRPQLIKDYNIDIFNCTPEQKEKVRPELVAFGKLKREESFGTFWTKKLEDKINKDESEARVVIVPDIRYDYYPHDEVWWVKEQMAGLLINVERYNVVKNKKEFIYPANEDEQKNSPKVKKAAHFNLSWKTLSEAELKEVYGGFIQTIINVVSREL